MKLVGDKKLLRKLNSLATKDAKASVAKGSRAGCKPIQQQTKSNAPKDSGALRNGIKVRSLRGKGGAIGCKVVVQIPPKGGKVGTRVNGPYYGLWQEEGWTPKAKVKGGGLVSGPPVEGKHFMQKAVETKGQQGLDICADVMKTEIEKRASN